MSRRRTVTPDMFKEAKKLLAEGELSQEKIAIKLATSQSTISLINKFSDKETYHKFANKEARRRRAKMYLTDEDVEKTPLEKLPVHVLKAKLPNGDYADVLVDGDYDGEYFSEFKWQVNKLGYVVTVNPNRYREGSRKYSETWIYLHRLVMPTKKGYWSTFKNGNKLDCRSANLAYMTPKQRIAERPQSKKKLVARSGYRGVREKVSTFTGKKSYLVKINKQHGGTFATAEQAAQAYDTQAKKLWGDKAVLNFPEGEPSKPVEKKVSLLEALKADGFTPENIEKLTKPVETPEPPDQTDRILKLLENIDDRLKKLEELNVKKKRGKYHKQERRYCSWCGGGLLPNEREIHEDCLEVKSRINGG